MNSYPKKSRRRKRRSRKQFLFKNRTRLIIDNKLLQMIVGILMSFLGVTTLIYVSSYFSSLDLFDLLNDFYIDIQDLISIVLNVFFKSIVFLLYILMSILAVILLSGGIVRIYRVIVYGLFVRRRHSPSLFNRRKKWY